MVISHNISALNTYKSLGIAGNAADSSMEKLSSGYKINKAADDAAGLSISEKMRSQIRGLNQASTNAENGVSMIQTAEGALNETHSILQRMRELAVQSATDTNADEDRESLQSEMEQLTNEVNRIGNTTEFNGMKILNGEKAKEYNSNGTAATMEITFAAGADADANKALAKEFADNFDQEGYKCTYTAGATKVTITSETIYKTDGTTQTTSETTAEKTAMTNLFKTGYKSGTTTIAAGDTVGTVTEGQASTLKEDNSVYFHVGANANQVINTEFNDMRAASLGVSFKYTDAEYTALSTDEKKYLTSTMSINNGTDTTASEYGLNISTREGANNAIEVIDNAIKTVSEERSRYGSIQNRLEYTMNNLNTTAENMTAAESTIRDVDMAEEMMEYTKNNILQQAAQAMLVQANARPQQALQLLQG